MKIAIQGHPYRGNEVIKILESLGGINDGLHKGNNPNCYYELHGNIIWCVCTKGINFKYCTLEEFEKEFPFKIGDKIMFPIKTKWMSGKITGLTYIEDKLKYEVNTRTAHYYYVESHKLQLYPMEKERNITLTLDKAKEWYKKGGELKEVALQAYSEEELTKAELPKSWEEFCKNYSIKPGETFIDGYSKFVVNNLGTRNPIYDQNICPSQKSAEAHLALIQLEQLRDCYNNNSDAWGWSYSIIKRNGIPELVRGCDHDTFLRFKNEEIAIQFLKNFKDLIEKAGDLI